MTPFTENEAKGKWCPHAVVNGHNRHPATGNITDAGMACVGSNCMAWRWVNGSEKASVGRGYCGLAGRP